MGTFGIAAGQAAINTASGIAGQLIGRIFGPKDRENQLKQQKALNEQAFDINNKMAEANYQREMRKWEDTNYSAQMEQLSKAGLNPALLYGMSGGGGATASTAAGQGVGAGQAEGSRQGMGIMPINMLELQNMKAQNELIKAQTEKTKAEAAKTAGVDTTLTGELIVAKRLENAYEGGTLEQRIANVSTEASKLMAEARTAGTEANITGATEQDQIETIQAEAINAVLQGEATKMGLQVSAQQIKESANKIAQGWKGLSIQEKGQAIQKFETEVKANYPSLFNVLGKSINDLVSSIIEKSGGGRAEEHRTEKQK